MKTLFLVSILALIVPGSARLWLRGHYEDAIVVERSELIVEGYLETKSIKYVRHKTGNHEGASWEHHAQLVVTSSESLSGVAIVMPDRSCSA